jgi:type IV pilus assembly protein PilC
MPRSIVYESCGPNHEVRKMPTFEFEGSDQSGRTVSGFLDGQNAAQVEELLIEQGIHATAIVEQGAWARFARPGHVLKPEEVVLLSDQLETIARSGMPLAPSIAVLAADARSRRVRRILKEIQRILESGGALSEALSRSGAGLPSAVLSLIRAGEQTGNLPAVLAQVSKHYTRITDARNAIRQAAAYPAVLIVAACLLLGVMSVSIIPQFASVYGSFGRSLPVPTRLVFDLSSLIGALFSRDMLRVWVALLLLLLGTRLYLGMSARGQTSHLRMQEWLRYRCPFLGPLYRVAATERFARVLGLLITNHAQAPEGLALAGVASGSLRVAQASQNAAVLVRNGSGLSEALAAMQVFRPSFLWVVGNAESQGELGSALLRLADTYEREVDRRATAVVTLAGPAVIVVVGVIFGTLIISLFMPILSLSSLFGGF